MTPGDSGQPQATSEPGSSNLATAAFAIFMIVALVAVFWVARDALASFLFAFLLIYMLLPVVHWIEKILPKQGPLARLARPIAALGASVLALVAILVLIGVLLDPVIDQTTELFNNLSGYWSQLKADQEEFREIYESVVPEQAQTWVDEHMQSIGISLLTGVAGIMSWLLHFTGSAISTVFAMVTIPLFIVYYLMDERTTAKTLREQLPIRWSADLISVFRIVDRILGSYTRGVILEAAIVGVITGFGYWLIGVELALPLGVVAFCGEIVPIIGPWIAFFISFPVVLATQPELAIPAILVFFVIQMLEGWFLAPRIQGGSVEFTSSSTLVLLAVGGALAGGLGMVFALPVAAMARALAIYVQCRLSGQAPDEARGGLRIFAEDSGDEMASDDTPRVEAASSA